MQARSLVIATGGLSIPKIGATDFGYRLAQQFGIPLVERRPGLVPLTFDGDAWAPYAQLAGLALPVEISTGPKKARTAFLEDLLFTHRGLSGRRCCRFPSYWEPGTPLAIDLAPGTDLPGALAQAKARSKKLIANELAPWCPAAWPTPGPSRAPNGSAPSTRPPTRPWHGWPSGSRTGNSRPPAPRATGRPRSRWAA